ncbi:MAG TPA: hypothetical protein VGD78_09125 [Chthoniobacterales bacterium]
MDTMTYASVAALPRHIVQNAQSRRIPEAEFVPLDLGCLRLSWLRRFQATGPCNDL